MSESHTTRNPLLKQTARWNPPTTSEEARTRLAEANAVLDDIVARLGVWASEIAAGRGDQGRYDEWRPRAESARRCVEIERDRLVRWLRRTDLDAKQGARHLRALHEQCAAVVQVLSDLADRGTDLGEGGRRLLASASAQLSPEFLADWRTQHGQRWSFGPSEA